MSTIGNWFKKHFPNAGLDVLAFIITIVGIFFVLWAVAAVVNKAKAETNLFVEYGVLDSFKDTNYFCGNESFSWIGSGTAGVQFLTKRQNFYGVPFRAEARIKAIHHNSCAKLEENEGVFDGYGLSFGFYFGL